jgi:hypothetical protein
MTLLHSNTLDYKYAVCIRIRDTSTMQGKFLEVACMDVDNYTSQILALLHKLATDRQIREGGRYPEIPELRCALLFSY